MRYNIILIITAFMLAGCSLIEDPMRDCPDVADGGDDTITLSFSMQTSGSVMTSRADSQHDEMRSEYREFEDAIDFSDCAVFVFAGSGEITGDESLVYKMINLGVSTDYDNSILGANGRYTVNLTIRRSQFKAQTGIDISPDGTEDINFRILLLANCSSPGTSAVAKWNQITGTTFKTVIEQLSAWRFAMGYIYNTTPAGGSVTDIYNKKCAPMFGTCVYTVGQPALYSSRPDDRLYLGSMDLLRAIAKVRVIDNISNKGADGYPRVSGAVFISSQTDACQLPYNALTYQNGTQVHTPNIAAPGNELKIEGASYYMLGSIPDTWTITPAAERKGGTWIGYVPEQRIAGVTGQSVSGMPVIRVSVEMDAETSAEYDVPMTGYKNTEFDFGDAILRNHVYSLSVDRVGTSENVELTVKVADWVEKSLTLDYSETVTVDRKLRWEPETYQSYDPATGNILLRPWSTTESRVDLWVPLKGYFMIQTPVGAKWIASLIPSDGDPVIMFLDDNNNPVQTVSGQIDGVTMAELRIVSTDVNPVSPNKARLQIIVSLPNGTVLEPDLTPDNTSGDNDFQYFTIVQNPI